MLNEVYQLMKRRCQDLVQGAGGWSVSRLNKIPLWAVVSWLCLVVGAAVLAGDDHHHSSVMTVGLVALLVGMVVLNGGFALWILKTLCLSLEELAQGLQSWAYRLALWGFSVAVVGLTILAGQYLALLFRGYLELRWALFWPSIVAAVAVCALGVRKKVVMPLRDASREWEKYVRRQSYARKPMIRTFFRDVLLQDDLLKENRFRWVRHILIYWGFVGLFIFDLSFAFISDFFPVFGLSQFAMRSHPIRMFIDLGLDWFGVVLLVGVCLGLFRAVMYWGKPGARYNYTVTTFFLFVVVVSGFWVEGIRLATVPPPEGDFGFGGWGTAFILQAVPIDWSAWYNPMWIFHGLASAAFIAHIPFYRIVHCIAVPAGKVLRSQVNIYKDKIEGVCKGLMAGSGDL